jgi:hypothetical protein
MQSLRDLLNSTAGRRFLESNDVFLNQDAFAARLCPPPKLDLVQLFEAPEQAKPVYMLQQIYVDYRRSFVCRAVLLQTFVDDAAVFPFHLWIDTDRCGADKLSCGFTWPIAGEKVFNLIPRDSKERTVETRFASAERRTLEVLLDRLEMYITQSLPRKQEQTRARAKYQQLRDAFLQEDGTALRAINARVTALLLSRCLDLRLPTVFTSEIYNRGLLHAAVNRCLNNITDVIRVYNSAVADLMRADIDPQVQPLDDSYLPLHYSCDIDRRRIRLLHQVQGGDHFAVGRCSCGADYRFHLGSTTLAIDELAATDRWSVDVTLPMHLNDLVSGYIGGKSSVLYNLVFREVLSKVLGRTPIPVLVPTELAAPEADEHRPFDSLIYQFITM